MKTTISVCSIALSAAFVGASCTSSDSPTSADYVPSAAETVAGGAPGPTSPYGSGPSYANLSQSLDEEFNCTNVSEVRVRFSDPGYVQDNTAGLFVQFVGMPPGRKVLRIWWDHENDPIHYQDVQVGDGEVQRDDDNLFDYEDVIAHSYGGITAETAYRVRVEMILDGKTGNCARVRDVVVGPGMATPSASRCSGQLLVNGGFEAGNLTGWTVSANGSSGCDSDWHLSGSGATGCSPVAAPIEGSFAAYNSFDGNGPQEFRLEQTFLVPQGVGSATLDWSDIARWSVGGQAREFRVDLVTPSGTVNVFSQSYSGSGNTGWTARSQNVTSALAANEGLTVTLALVNAIPQSFTGPAGFGADAVSLTCSP